LKNSSDYLMTHAGPSGGYRIDCPACNASQTGNIREWPPHFAQPFGFVCACGHFFHVFVNVRSHHRKPCQLWGEYRLMQQGRQIEGVCTVLDISQAGARVEANHLTNIEIGGLLRLVVALDDASHSRTLLSGKIRWVTTQPKGVMMGIRFENLDAHSQQKLGFYVL
jgi:PilZ domain